MRRLRVWWADPLGWRRALAGEARSRELAREASRVEVKALAGDMRGILDALGSHVTDRLDIIEGRLEQVSDRLSAIEEQQEKLIELVARHGGALRSHKEAFQIHERRLDNHMRTMKRMTPDEQRRFAKLLEAGEKRRLAAIAQAGQQAEATLEAEASVVESGVEAVPAETLEDVAIDVAQVRDV